MTDIQQKLLVAVDRSILNDSPDSTKEKNLHLLIKSLFSHINRDHSLNKFFSAISCFSVLLSFKHNGQMLRPTQIKSYLNHLIYANRTCQLTEMRNLVEETPEMETEK